MRVVVTGAAGFIGSNLCDALLDAGHEVTGIDCFTDYYGRDLKLANLSNARQHPSFDFAEVDLRHGLLDDLVDGADAVINEAATPGLLLSWDDFERYESCNVYAVHRLIKVCQRRGVPRFVQASTSSVYGPLAMGHEELATRPISPYGVTKLAAEHLLLAYHDMFAFPVIILRYFSVYGPRQRPDMAYRTFCDQLLNGEPVTIYGDGLQSRGNTYISDCVDATMAAMRRGASGDVFNIGGASEIALIDAIKILADEIGVEPLVRFEAARPGDQRRTIADVTSANAALGWTPRVLPEDGLRRQARWVIQHGRAGYG